MSVPLENFQTEDACLIFAHLHLASPCWILPCLPEAIKMVIITLLFPETQPRRDGKQAKGLSLLFAFSTHRQEAWPPTQRAHSFCLVGLQHQQGLWKKSVLAPEKVPPLGLRGWTWWSLWVPFNMGYSMIPWFCDYPTRLWDWGGVVLLQQLLQWCCQIQKFYDQLFRWQSRKLSKGLCSK